MELVGIDTLEKVVNNFVTCINPDFSARLGPDFMADTTTDIIDFSVVVIEREDELFLEDIYTREGKIPMLSNFLWSILHEIGHLETKEEMEDDTDERIRIAALSEYDSNAASYEYHQLYNEVIATDWAVSFAIDNTVLCIKWDNALMDVVNSFFLQNEVE